MNEAINSAVMILPKGGYVPLKDALIALYDSVMEAAQYKGNQIQLIAEFNGVFCLDPALT